MKIEWLAADVTPVGSPDRLECDILEMVLDIIIANSGRKYL